MRAGETPALPRVIFLCRDNGALGPLAEGLARQMYGAAMTLASAGVEPGRLHPLAVETMREINIDIAAARPRLLDESDLGSYDIVVVICERNICPPLPRGARFLHWPIMDPRDPPAPDAELRRRFRDARTAIAKHLKSTGWGGLGRGVR